MGTYRIVKKLATGGMAEVFLGKVVGAEGFEKPVAVKRILSSYAQDSSFVELFLREAKVSVALQHANVMQVLDLGASDGQYYMVLEFVDGEDLRKLLKAARLRKLSLGLREMCFIAQQVAEGLSYAHTRTDSTGAPLNIVHRDINPANVMVASNGEVKLADFGIAKVSDGRAETQVGVLKGKIHYLSPEQVLNRPVDQRSDIFLLGLLLYELLAGHQLFDGGHLQVVQQIGGFDERALTPIPGVPAPLWAVLVRALAASPEARFRTAREFSDALQSFLFDHRLRVGASDVAALFRRAFPERPSPLNDLASQQGEEIHLESQVTPPAVPAAPARPPLHRADVRKQAPPGAPPVLRPSGPTPSTPPRLVPSGAPERTPPAQTPKPPGAKPARSTRRLGEVLVARGFITPKELEEGLALQKRKGGRLGQLLVAEGRLDSEDLIRALSEQSGLPHITDDKLQTMPVPEELLRLVSQDVCEKLCAVPVMQRGRELYCAVQDPRDLKVMDALKFAARAISVHGLLASEHAIHRAIRRFYLGKQAEVALGDSAGPEPTGNRRIMQFVEQFTGRRVLDEEQIAGAASAEATSASPEQSPAARPPAQAPASPARARMVLVVADAEGPRDAAVKLLLIEGVAAAASPAAAAEQALALGGYEVALVVENAVQEPATVVARLRAAHPALDVRLVPSLSAAMTGEGGPLARLEALRTRMLDGALTMLGGSAALAPHFVRLARRCAARMGAGIVEEALVGTAAQALALAARLEDPKRFALPSLGRVRAISGNEHPEVVEVLSAVLAEAAQAAPPTSRAAEAVLCAAAFTMQTQSAQTGLAEAAKALGVLRQNPRLSPTVLEALTTELGSGAAGAQQAPKVVVADTDAANALTLQVRLMAEGLSVHRARTRAETEKALGAGASAVILATTLPDGETHSLVRSLRAAPATAPLPLFLLASGDDPAVVTAGLEAGADDVLMRPINIEVLTAKLRRALAQRQLPRRV